MGSRRKKPDGPGDDGALAAVTEVPPEANGTPAPPDAAAGPACPNRPAASFAAPSDRGTRVEVAVWSKRIVITEQEEYTRYNLTLSRSWRDKEGNWFGNASFRLHDVPVLLYLVQQAYNWCVAQRTEVHVESNGDVPF
jgi:hypothetical protein